MVASSSVTRPSSVPGLSFCLQQVSAMQMEEGSCSCEISSVKLKPRACCNMVQ